MRAIRKGQEPAALMRYRSQPDAAYDGPQFTPVKTAIRDSLLAEQDHLCAYCMRRIRVNTMKIEHWHSQERYLAEQLDYRNLLGVCPGNEGQPYREQTCDTRKGDNDLRYNPADPTHHIESRIRYPGDGRIQADEPDFDEQLNRVLNLNQSRLMNNRKAVIDTVMQALDARPGTRKPGELRRLRQRWTTANSNNELPEYCGVAIYYLDKRLRRSSRAR